MTDLIDTISTLINNDPFLLFFGGFYFVLGLSCFFAREAWQEFAELFSNHNSLSLIIGIVILPISLSIIAFYNNWETIASTVLMVVGWMAFIKALVLLLRPQLFQGLIKKQFVRQWIWLDGLAGVALGGAMLFL